jgi:excisionase family DNA binding protein
MSAPTQPIPPIGPLLISIQQAGKLLSVGRTQAYRWAHDGIIPTFKIGTVQRVPVWLLTKKVQSLAEAAIPDAAPTEGNITAFPTK